MAEVLNTTSAAYKAWLLRAKGPMVCAPSVKSSRGIWFLENPMSNVFAMYLFQFVLVSLLTKAFHFVLRPLRQTKLVCYFLAGLVMSPNVMGRFKIFKGVVYLYTLEEMLLARTVGVLGLIYFLFLLAVKIDVGLIRRTKTFREATLIGVLSVVAAYLGIFALAFTFELPGIEKGFFRARLAVGLSLTRFPNVAHTFNELNILSSELGNLAVSCTFVSEIIAWWWLLIGQYIWHPYWMGLSVAYTAVIVIVFFLVVRPGIWFIIRMTPDGMPVKEGYILLILVVSLVFGFVTDLVSSMQLGMLIFGLIIPSGSPLGSTLAEKAELIVSELLFPMYYVSLGYSSNVSLLTPAVTIQIVVLVMTAALLKLTTTALIGYFLCDKEFRHSLLLGLMLNIRGPYDTFLLFRWIVAKSIDRQAFTVLTLSDILLTAMVTPWIDLFYNPHARLSAWTGKNTAFFLTAPRNVELRVLCCIEAEDNVPSIISLLETMNPTKASSIRAYVVHMNELVGHATPIMLPYNRKMQRMASKGSSPIMRAFENYSRNSLGLVSVRPYMVVSAYKSMHEYICRLTLQELIPLIIIPFQANLQTNTVEVTAMRIVNSNVQTYSPCTVGVLVNKGFHQFIQASDFSLSTAVVFFSGNDDREALAFGIRMTGKPNVRVNLIRIIVTHQEAMSTEERAEKKLDDSMIDQFLEEKGKSEGTFYQEIVAEDAGQVMQSLRNLDVHYNLIVVGRKRKNSLLAEDLMQDWSENPELGVLGDLIASSDHYASTSVLVMQHFGDVNVRVKSESNEGEGEGDHLLRGKGARPCLPDRNTITMSINVTSYGTGAGYMITGPVVCTQGERHSGGFWYGEDPRTRVFTMFLLQFILIRVVSHMVNLLLRPLRQPRVICNVVAGIIVSPNIMGHWKILQKMLLSPEDLLLVRTLGLLSIMFYILLSVKTDLGVLRRNFRKASIIGFLSILGSFVTALLLIYVLELPGINKGYFNMSLAVGLSVTRFANVAFIINELNIFASELGQLAVSSTSELLGWFWTIIGVHMHFPVRMLLSASFCLAILMFFYFVLRPGLSDIIRRTPEGKPVKESYILVLIIGSMVIGFLTCLIGSMLFGFFIFGLMIPHGRPLGATLAEKTESFVSEILFPMFFISIGYSLNFSVLEAKDTAEIFVVVTMVAVMKLVATGLSAYFLVNLPVGHSLLLGLMMNIKGPYDLYLFFLWISSQKIDRQTFTALTVFEMLLSAVVIPWIDKFYTPHARLRASTGRNRRFLLTAPRDFELPVICCLCGEDDVPSIISLLETLNPREASPILVHAVHLNELIGHANPEIISMNKKRMTRARSKGSYHIMRAFENLSANYDGSVRVKTYSVIAAYKSMHEYICILAMQEFVPLIIIPFQANFRERTAMRCVNRNMQAYSPCTVGLLVDKGISRIGQLQDHSMSIAIVFISGEDDREALALAIRMAGHPNTRVTLIRVVAINEEVESVEKEEEMKRDVALIEQFMAEHGRKYGDAYRELLVENAEQMMHQLRCSEGVYNLIVVGRKQKKTSLLPEDMMLEWSENPELGVLGDLITSAEFFSTTLVLVMQHFGDVHTSVQDDQTDVEDGLFSLVFWA